MKRAPIVLDIASAAVDWIRKRSIVKALREERKDLSDLCKVVFDNGKPCWLQHDDEGGYYDDCCPTCEQARAKHFELMDASTRSGAALRRLIRVVKEDQGGILPTAVKNGGDL